jgi:hypothetical protein
MACCPNQSLAGTLLLLTVFAIKSYPLCSLRALYPLMIWHHSMCELVVPPQTAHIVLSGTFCHAIVGTQTVLEVAIREKFFRLETTKNAHGGFG